MRTTSAHWSDSGSKRCTTQGCCGCRAGSSTILLSTGFIPARFMPVSHVQQWGPAVILSDGDAVFQPRKIERSGLWAAFEDRVLIYVHKEQELAEVERLLSGKAVCHDR